MRDGVEVARDLGVDPAVGLSSAEAERRLTAEGPNELQPEPPVPLWRTIRRIRTASGEIEFTGVLDIAPRAPRRLATRSRPIRR